MDHTPSQPKHNLCRLLFVISKPYSNIASLLRSKQWRNRWNWDAIGTASSTAVLKKISIWWWPCTASLLLATIAAIGAATILPTFLAIHGSTLITAQHLPMSWGTSTKEVMKCECRYHALSNRWLPCLCNVDLAREAIMKFFNHEAFQFCSSSIRPCRVPFPNIAC